MTSTPSTTGDKTNHYIRQIQNNLNQISAIIEHVRTNASNLFEEERDKEVRKVVEYLAGEGPGSLNELELCLDTCMEGEMK